MDTELRKRLEEAAKNFRGYFLGRMNKCRKLKGKEPYYADNEIMDICLDVAEIGYKEGAGYGYKEAIKAVKEWWKQGHVWLDLMNVKDSNDLGDLINNFEADMNKNWEESK